MSTAKKIAQSPADFPQEISFNIPEFILYDRTALWFIGIFMLFSGLVVLAIQYQDFWLAIIVLLGAMVFYQTAFFNPRPTKIKLNPKGLSFRKKFHPWSEFRSFSIFEQSRFVLLHLESRSFLAGPLTINLPRPKFNQTIIKALRCVLPEKLHSRPTLNDFIAELIRF